MENFNFDTSRTPDQNVLCKLESKSLMYLSDGAKWARFLAIVGFILLSIMLLTTIFATSLIATVNNLYFHFNQTAIYIFLLSYLVFTLIYFFPFYYLYKASSNLLIAIKDGSVETLDAGFSYLRSHYRYVGIFTIVIIGFYLLLFLFTVVFGVLMYAH